MATSETVKWIRKATESERECEELCKYGPIRIWYQLDLSSLECLQEEHVRRALIYLYKKVPSLDLCFGTKDGEMWFKRATNPDVDFEVLHGVTLEDIRKQLCNQLYKNDTGPLFSARLVYDSPAADNDPYNLEPTLSHKCHILFGFHHAMTDGTSNMYIMGFFISLLNDVIAEKPVDDEKPLGTFSSDEETAKLIERKKSILERDPRLRKKIADDFQFQKDNAPLITKLLYESDENPHTINIEKTLNQEVTSQFLQRCRQEKITVSSVITALVNMAIVKVLMNHGVHLDTYMIQIAQTVNIRRYWESKPNKPLGLHVMDPLMLYTKTPPNIHKHFWEYARKLGENLKENVLSQRIFLDTAFLQMFPRGTSLHNGNKLAYDYTTSFMGNVTNMVTEGGDYVKITNIVRGSTIQSFSETLLVNAHTFRGLFTLSFNYSTRYIQKDMAEQIFKETIISIDEILQS